MQLSDALSDRNKATETISSLQVRVNSNCSLSMMHTPQLLNEKKAIVFDS